MLSLCATKSRKEEKYFMIVEICEDIWIGNVQLTNFELFSGVFKDLAVRVVKGHTRMSQKTTVGMY